MTTTITTRVGKGGRLSFTEMDANFTNLKATADAAAVQATTYLKSEVDSALATKQATLGFTPVNAATAVTSVASRTGSVVLTVADINGSAPLASPTFTGTVTGTFSGNGAALTSLTGANVTGTVPLATSAVTISGTYAGSLTSSQVITGLGFTPQSAGNKDIAGGYPGLDASGKISTSALPAIAITDTFVVASQAAMLALTAQTGDVAVRTDLNKTFILKGTSSSTLTDWQELLTPTDLVQSVNGMTGAVTLTSSNVAEGSNLYFTTARASVAAPVQTVFGRSGAIVLASSDVTAALGFTPVDGSTAVNSVAGRTGAVVLTVADVSGAAPQATTYTKTEVDAASVSLNRITGTTTNATINNSLNTGLVLLSTFDTSAAARSTSISISESVASTKVGGPNVGASLLKVNTLAGSTAYPVLMGARGQTIFSITAVGAVNINGFNGSATEYAGSIGIKAGTASSSLSGASGGILSLSAGNGDDAGLNPGGSTSISSGNSFINALAGAVNITPGINQTTNDSGNINLTTYSRSVFPATGGQINLVISNNSGGNSAVTSLVVSNGGVNITGNTVVAGSMTSTVFVGSGSLLTNLPGANVTGTVPLATSAVTISGTYTGSLTSSQVTSGLGFTPASSGSNTSLSLVNGAFGSATLTTSATTVDQLVDSIAITAARSVKYLIQITSGTSYHATEMLIIHDGTTAYVSQSNDVFTGVILASFNSTIVSGNLQLLVTPVNAVSTIKVIRTSVAV